MLAHAQKQLNHCRVEAPTSTLTTEVAAGVGAQRRHRCRAAGVPVGLADDMGVAEGAKTVFYIPC